MLSNLLGGPAPGGQHGDGKLGGGQIVCHIVAGDRVVHPPPAGGEAVGNVDNPSEILRPLRLDGGFQHGTQQTVVLPEALNQVVRPGQLPGFQQMLPGPVRLLQAHIAHYPHQVQVNGGDGVGMGSHGQGSLHHPHAAAILPLEIQVVGLHIQGKCPQSRGKQGEKILRRGHFLRQGNVPFGAGFHISNGLPALPRGKGGVHQGHKMGKQLRRFPGLRRLAS